MWDIKNKKERKKSLNLEGIKLLEQQQKTQQVSGHTIRTSLYK